MLTLVSRNLALIQENLYINSHIVTHPTGAELAAIVQHTPGGLLRNIPRP